MQQIEEREKLFYERIEPLALFSVLMCGIALGVIAHEMVHLLLMSYPQSVSIHFGDPKILFSSCCLAPGEKAYEYLALGIQLIVTLAWTILNMNLWITKLPVEK